MRHFPGIGEVLSTTMFFSHHNQQGSTGAGLNESLEASIAIWYVSSILTRINAGGLHVKILLDALRFHVLRAQQVAVR